jgi:hypothetical protein
MPSVREEIFAKTCTGRPRGISKEILALCTEIVPGVSPIIVKTKPTPGAVAQNCFYNVRACAERNGGESSMVGRFGNGRECSSKPNIMRSGSADVTWST